MAVMIRLAKVGKKGEGKFRIVVKEKRSKRDGKALEILGWFEKREKGKTKQINMERYNYWVSKGATPSPTVAKIVENQK